jgi:hypothetical protein
MTAGADRLALVRDRELTDLIEALDTASDLIAFVGTAGDKLRAAEAEAICATLSKTVAVLCELREAQP